MWWPFGHLEDAALSAILLVVITNLSRICRFRIVGLALVCAGLFAACGSDDADAFGDSFAPAPVSDEEAVLPVSVEPAELRDLPITVTGRGEVLPGDRRSVWAPFSAVVEAVFVGTGESVQAGKPILRLSTVELERSLTAAQDRLLAAQNRLAERLRNNPNLANRSSESIDSLQAELTELGRRYAAGGLDFTEYSRRHTETVVRLINLGAFNRDLAEIDAGISDAQRAVLDLQEQIDDATIASPIDGILELQEINVGEPMSAGRLVATVQSFEPARVRVSLVEEDALQVFVGNRATVTLGVSGTAKVSGVVDRVSPERGSSGGYPVDLLIARSDLRLLSGMFARAEIVVAVLPERIVVPVDALLRENENYYVFVVQDGLAWWRWVEVGRRSGDYVEVAPDPFTPSGEAERIHGVDPGELVAVAGHTLLGHKGRVLVDDAAQR